MAHCGRHYFEVLGLLELFSELPELVPLFAPPGLVAAPWLAPGAAWFVLEDVELLGKVELLGVLVELPVPLLGSSPVPVPPPWF